jgi:hypothetical protein
METKLPTAEEILKDWGVVSQIDGSMLSGSVEAMIEFAQICVTAALEKAAASAKTKIKAIVLPDEIIDIEVIDRDSIIESFSLDLIK